MLKSEFEELTGIYPDKPLWDEIEEQYALGNWQDTDSFCYDYKTNANGLPKLLQSRANEKLWRKKDAHRHTIASNNMIIEDLQRFLIEAKTSCAEFEKRCKELESNRNDLHFDSMSNTDAVHFSLKA